MKLRADDANGTEFMSKFTHKVQEVFSGLPKLNRASRNCHNPASRYAPPPPASFYIPLEKVARIESESVLGYVLGDRLGWDGS